ncbi:hypothetical protein C2E23DRAFT_344965 [Lenzites betulinus]|nr:hypothetical protein C2E23DRAFT_344965 [Lenzites betulinus]
MAPYCFPRHLLYLFSVLCMSNTPPCIILLASRSCCTMQHGSMDTGGYLFAAGTIAVFPNVIASQTEHTALITHAHNPRRGLKRTT